MRLTACQVASPIGALALATDEDGRLRGVSFGDGLARAMAREYPGVATWLLRHEGALLI